MRPLLFFLLLFSSAGLIASMMLLASQYDAGMVPRWLVSLLPGNADAALVSGRNFYIFGVPAVAIAGAAFLWIALLSAAMTVSGYVSSMLSLVLSSLSWILFGACVPYAVIRIAGFDILPVHFVLYGSSFLAAAASAVLLRSEKRRDAKFFEEATKSLLSFREPRARFGVAMIFLVAVMSAAFVIIMNSTFVFYAENTRLSARNNSLVAGDFFRQKREYSSLPETTAVLGGDKARVKIAVFTDPFCPACISFYRVEKALAKEFGSDVLFCHYMYPLSRGGCDKPASDGGEDPSCGVSKMFYAAAATGRLGIFIEKQTEKSGVIRDLYAKKRPRVEMYREYSGGDAGFKEFDEVVSSASTGRRLKLDISFADRLGIVKTPTIFINGRRLGTPARRDLMELIIREELRNRGGR
jgi:hypothetical protein